MAEILTRQELEDAKVDVATLETVVNGAADTPVTSRLGTTLKTVATVLNQVSAAIATVPTFSWLFASSTTMGNPSTGNVRFNNATLASVTAIAIAASSADTGNPDLSDLITKWDDSTSSLKGHLYIKKANTGTFVIFAVTGAITDNTSWLQLPVTFVASNGTLSASDSLLFYFVPKGDAGSISSVGSAINMNGNQLQLSKGADIPSANTLPTPTDGNYADVTGTTTITSIASSGVVGTEVRRHFDGALTLTHHATNLILPTNANIITAAGDEAKFIEYEAGKWRCVDYQRADGEALAASGSMILLSTQEASSSATVDFTTLIDSTYKNYVITGTNITCNIASNLLSRFYISGSLVSSSSYNNTRTKVASDDTNNNYYSNNELTHAQYGMSPSNFSTSSVSSASFVMNIPNPSSTNKNKGASTNMLIQSGSNVILVDSASCLDNIGPLTGVRFYQDAGTISGTFKLYGVL